MISFSVKKTEPNRVKSLLMMATISAEAISNNIDLLTEILLRLPTKPLIKFKSVSKQWLCLISDPQFTLSHTRHHHTPNSTPTALLFNTDYTPTPEFQILPLKQHDDDTVCKVPFLDYLRVPRVKIYQSCNGLLLCTSSLLMRANEQRWKTVTLNDETVEISFPPYVDYCSSVVTEDDRGFRYFICNPTTKKFKKLCFPSHQFKNAVASLNLAFDPFKSIYYKVISICRGRENRSLRCRIDMYSSETDSWNLLGITFKEPDGMRFNDAVFCNGAIHWASNDVNSLYFDVDNQCLKTMPMPVLREGLHYRDVRYFGESCGRLHLVVTYDPSAWKFDVLEMAADYSQWFVRYHVNVRISMPELSRYRWKYYPFYVLGVIRSEKEEESMVVLFMNGRAVSYNPYNGTFKKLCDLQSMVVASAGLTSSTLDYRRSKAYQYFETLSYV